MPHPRCLLVGAERDWLPGYPPAECYAARDTLTSFGTVLEGTTCPA